MRAFLSHSSADKAIVVGVYSELEADSTWLDRAEIEWGNLFLEKIADGIRLATDFVLFWSKAASESEWVRIEINMAFIQALRKKAIRLRVITLDDTPYLSTCRSTMFSQWSARLRPSWKSCRS